jgi:integrase
MARKALTDRTLKALKAARHGEHYDVWDTVIPGFGVRVSETGRKTFVLAARYGGSSNPTRRAIGPYGAITLADARKEAQDWLKLIEAGKDPAEEKKRHRDAEARRRANTFGSVAEDFIREKLAGERKGYEVERDIRRVFIEAWGTRPIVDITASDVVSLIKRFRNEGKLYQAHNLLGYARRLWNWAIGQHAYGIQHSPCDRLRPKDIIGERQPRTRILSDAELRVAWKAAESLGYPYGPLFRLLLLTGQRKSEVAEAQWSEFDLAKKLWVIPAERMKADAAHVVPLSDDAIALLKSLPRFQSGDYLFSTTFGKQPVNGFSKAKARFDGRMIKIVREGDAKARLADFVIHDLRRTLRTGLSAIPGISDLVRELVIGHAKPGLHKVYDQYAYLDEKRFALDAWAARLRSIVEPAAANVVSLRA